MPLTLGALECPSVRLKIDKMVYGGDGLARMSADERGPGKSVFVPFVLEGEVVEAALIEQKPGFARAKLNSIVESASTRVHPDCPYFQRCGGCHYQHSSYAHQLEIKKTVLLETLRRTAKIELPCEPEVHASKEWNYRNRTRLKARSSPTFALGYYKFRSHDFLPVEQCPISSPLINRAIGAISGNSVVQTLSTPIREIELFANAADDSLLLEIYCSLGTSRRDARSVADAFIGVMDGIRGVAVFEPLPANTQQEPKRIAETGDVWLSYEAGTAHRVSAGSFFQVNRFLIETLVDLVSKGKKGQLALDLYAGVGLFSQALAQSFAQVIAVEPSQTSYHDLRHNAVSEVKAVRATTEQYLAGASLPGADLIVVDPPRGGLGENVVRNLAKVGHRVTYVSCDPSTLARDLRTFAALGYRIEGAHMIDLFPQTFHIESVFHLAR
jgi:23S rRNA (uracil1939-C5)-methyltransferase